MEAPFRIQKPMILQRKIRLISIEELGVAGLEPAEAEAGGFTVTSHTTPYNVAMNLTT